jgi:tetratricopeptide (TPR) repeat protein
MDASGQVGQRARRFLNTKLPANPIGRDAEQRNIEGYNLMVSNQKEEAKKVFTKLIEDYPRFEWPYNNLAGIYVEESNAAKAEQLCRQALEINPHYTNARTTWAQANIVARDFPGAEQQIELALKEDPDDHWANMLKERLDLLKPGAKIPD